MIPAIALFATCIILPVVIVLDTRFPSRLAESIEEWADANGYRIRELQPFPRPFGFQFGVYSLAQRLFVVEVVCSSGRPSRFILKAGGYFWGDRVKKLAVYEAGDAARTTRFSSP